MHWCERCRSAFVLPNYFIKNDFLVDDVPGTQLVQSYAVLVTACDLVHPPLLDDDDDNVASFLDRS